MPIPRLIWGSGLSDNPSLLVCYISDLGLPERKFGKLTSRREEAKDAGYVKGGKTVRTQDKKIKGWFCFKRQAGDHKNQLATFPGLVASPSSGRRHGKKDDYFMYSLYRAHVTGGKDFHESHAQYE